MTVGRTTEYLSRDGLLLQLHVPSSQLSVFLLLTQKYYRSQTMELGDRRLLFFLMELLPFSSR